MSTNTPLDLYDKWMGALNRYGCNALWSCCFFYGFCFCCFCCCKPLDARSNGRLVPSNWPAAAVNRSLIRSRVEQFSQWIALDCLSSVILWPISAECSDNSHSKPLRMLCKWIQVHCFLCLSFRFYWNIVLFMNISLWIQFIHRSCLASRTNLFHKQQALNIAIRRMTKLT